MVSEIYSISGDFPNQVVAAGVLEAEILLEFGSSPLCEYVSTYGDVCTIEFDIALSGPQKTTLDGIVAAHQGTFTLTSTEITLVNEEHGSIAYYDGYDWVPLAPSTDGYVLATQGAGADPEWVEQTGGSAGLPTGYVSGLVPISNDSSPTTSVDIDAGSCRDGYDTFDIVSESVLTADITTSGANGLDTGSETADTWYAIHVIDDSSNVNPVASLLSESHTDPVLPSGYDKFRYVGWVRNNSSSNFLRFSVSGNGSFRHYSYTDSLSGLQVFANQEPTTWTTVSLDDYVPPTSVHFDPHVQLSVGNNDFVEFRVTGTSLANGEGRPIYGGPTTTLRATNTGLFPTSSSQQIDYRRNDATGAGVDLYVYGFADTI